MNFRSSFEVCGNFLRQNFYIFFLFVREMVSDGVEVFLKIWTAPEKQGSS